MHLILRRTLRASYHIQVYELGLRLCSCFPQTLLPPTGRKAPLTKGDKWLKSLNWNLIRSECFHRRFPPHVLYRSLSVPARLARTYHSDVTGNSLWQAQHLPLFRLNWRLQVQSDTKLQVLAFSRTQVCPSNPSRPVPLEPLWKGSQAVWGFNTEHGSFY